MLRVLLQTVKLNMRCELQNSINLQVKVFETTVNSQFRFRQIQAF